MKRIIFKLTTILVFASMITMFATPLTAETKVAPYICCERETFNPIMRSERLNKRGGRKKRR